MFSHGVIQVRDVQHVPPMTPRRTGQRGIAATEYLIILIVVVLGTIMLFRRYGTTIQAKTTAANTNVADTLHNTNPTGQDVQGGG